MKTSGNTILITGGATGIGLALAENFLKNDNKVLICGRRENKLKEAKEKYPELDYKVCDAVNIKQREELFGWAVSNHPELNMIINNAGIQHPALIKKGTEDFEKIRDEIAINFEALIHLCMLFTPHLMKQKDSAIMNVTSGLAFSPISFMPVYCATKAAVHSFTMSLRHQLKDTSVKVFELIPPIVDTELDQGERDKRGVTDRGIKPEAVAVETIEAMKNDKFEIAVERAVNIINKSRENPDEFFKMMNR
jgi:uncharacterized oxidoreductase